MKKIVNVLLFTLCLFVIAGCSSKEKKFVIECDKELLINNVYNIDCKLDGKEVIINEFEIENEEIVYFYNNKVLAAKVGKTNVKFIVNDDGKKYEKTIEFIVNEMVASLEKITIEGSNGLALNSTLPLIITQFPKDVEEDIIWSSSDNLVATVSSDGVVTPIKEGFVQITATAQNDINIFGTHNVSIFEISEETSAENGKYKAEQLLAYNDLGNDIKQYTYKGYTSTDASGIDADGLGPSTELLESGKYYEQQINILDIGKDSNAEMVVWANLDNHIWTLTTVRNLMIDYESKHPGYKVTAAINADFFDINGNGNLKYQPSGSLVSQGEYYKTSASRVIGFTNDDSTVKIVGGKDPVRTECMILSVYNEKDEIVKNFDVKNLNKEPGENESSVYFGIYNNEHNYISRNVDTTSFKFVIGNAELALPNNSTDFYGKGTITSTDNITLQIGQFAIVTNNNEVKETLKIGTKVRIQYQYTNELENISSVVGIHDIILSNGEMDQECITSGYLNRVRFPRTVIGTRADGSIVLMVTDGRQENMYGIDGKEAAAIMKSTGCVSAYGVDGGGSSTMVIHTTNGYEVLNSPSDGNERRDSDCVLVVVKDPSYTIAVTDITTSSATINVTTTDKEYQDKKAYILIDDTFHEVKNGKLELNNLVHNNTYNYQLFYELDGKKIQTYNTGSFQTNKIELKYNTIVVTETDDSYIISNKYYDVDDIAKTLSVILEFNSYTKTFLTNEIILSKESYGDEIIWFNATVSYSKGNGTGRETKEITDYFYIDNRTSK